MSPAPLEEIMERVGLFGIFHSLRDSRKGLT